MFVFASSCRSWSVMDWSKKMSRASRYGLNLARLSPFGCIRTSAFIPAPRRVAIVASRSIATSVLSMLASTLTPSSLSLAVTTPYDSLPVLRSCISSAAGRSSPFSLLSCAVPCSASGTGVLSKRLTTFGAASSGTVGISSVDGFSPAAATWLCVKFWLSTASSAAWRSSSTLLCSALVTCTVSVGLASARSLAKASGILDSATASELSSLPSASVRVTMLVASPDSSISCFDCWYPRSSFAAAMPSFSKSAAFSGLEVTMAEPSGCSATIKPSATSMSLSDSFCGNIVVSRVDSGELTSFTCA